MAKQGEAMLDVGVHRLPDGSFIRDAQMCERGRRGLQLTPVIDGVGPMAGCHARAQQRRGSRAHWAMPLGSDFYD
jgi:hypothetical protein